MRAVLLQFILPTKVPRVDKGPCPHQLRQVEDCHHTVSCAVGGGLRALRHGAARQPRVRPQIRGLWVEQSGPYNGAGCSGTVLLLLHIVQILCPEVH